MLVAKEYNGIFYHYDHYDDYDDEFILDENGDKIPTTICLCAAHEPSECCCACDWSDYRYDYDDQTN